MQLYIFYSDTMQLNNVTLERSVPHEYDATQYF